MSTYFGVELFQGNRYNPSPVLVLRDGGIGQNFKRHTGFYENIRREAGF